MQAKSLDLKMVAEVIHSGKAFQTVPGDLKLDKKGNVSNDGDLVNAKRKDRYVLYTWKKAQTAS